MTTPCKDPKNDPDDWFIDRRGLQYDDDVLATFEEADAEVERLEALGETDVDVTKVFEDLFEAAKKAQLVKRRHAKDACYTCPLRTECLDLALDLRRPHGTWGGYYEEELGKLYREIDRRKARRVAPVGA